MTIYEYDVTYSETSDATLNVCVVAMMWAYMSSAATTNNLRLKKMSE